MWATNLAILFLVSQLVMPIYRNPSGGAACGEDLSSDADLLLHLRLEESGASTRVDSSAAGNDMSVNGTISQNTSLFKEGSASNESAGGGTDGLERTDANLSSAFCGKAACADAAWGGWIQFDTVSVNDTYFNKGANIRIQMRSTGKLRCLTNDGQAEPADSNSALSTATWYHVICQLDDAGDSLTMYLDGTAQTDVETVTGTMTTDTDPFRMFEESTGSNGSDGRMDEVFLFKRTLTAQERDDIRTCGIDGSGLP